MRLKRTHTIFIFRSATLVVWLGMLFSFTATAQQATPEYQVKAVFLFNFTRFVDWPPSSFESANSPFIIGIIGTDPFGSYIDETVSGETAGQHAIVVKRFKTIKEISNCQVLYIAATDDVQLKEIISECRDKPILTVSDISNFTLMGGVIGFVIESDKIRMQINTESAKAASLVISSKLLRLAKGS